MKKSLNIPLKIYKILSTFYFIIGIISGFNFYEDVKEKYGIANWFSVFKIQSKRIIISFILLSIVFWIITLLIIFIVKKLKAK